MWKKVFLVLLAAGLASGCQNVRKVEKPDNLIPEDKMVDIIAEISLMQSARNFNKKLFEESGTKPQKYILEKYNVDSLQIKKSSDYYADNVSVYERIYDSVKSRFEKLKVKLDSVHEREEAIKDSIAQIEIDSLAALDSLNTDNKLKDIPADSLVEEEKQPEKDSLIEPVSNQ
ncbi:protein of unknown function [Salegentibacter echinorum]|uniref:DUF4296 domain-containing protein n=1 Tax=Salegentibacter echinorum TaxID=1073325 RepID=A0A1M5EQQ9_SALEC|nr:DUF4296 domain-containing protein [Salegentibacter echinorum]SHF81362.1 protein of unknown function [Salegentibacter echinorum]